MEGRAHRGALLIAKRVHIKCYFARSFGSHGCLVELVHVHRFSPLAYTLTRHLTLGVLGRMRSGNTGRFLLMFL
jgi:hypothetical protein